MFSALWCPRVCLLCGILLVQIPIRVSCRLDLQDHRTSSVDQDQDQDEDRDQDQDQDEVSWCLPDGCLADCPTCVTRFPLQLQFFCVVCSVLCPGQDHIVDHSRCSRSYGGGPLQCIAVHCSALQCIAFQCSAVQCNALHCSAL